ncbi:MAG: cysteine--tRNA ligase [Planctomycetota bacterium]|nr:cysteine--tRNA ligase [Planctomycetota bacterium]
MSFVVHNSYSKRKEPFEVIEPGKVRMYNCGPTVYDRAHIGNFRSYLFADVLRRWLEYLGYEVRQVMNITDVGHIREDADEGEDKLDARARAEKRDPWAISREYTEVFFRDSELLGIEKAHVYPRATDHIPEMLAIVEDLIAKGHAYRVDENVYFDVTSFERYGNLSGNKVENLDAGARVEVRKEKRHPADFALWKSDPQHLMKWESAFGPHGFPGWHIECSAMAIKHLGKEIDIHTGGEDNVFPHHECEIAQSESHTGKRFARFWMHAKFLKIDGGKMAKSLGNFYTLDDVTERGVEPRALRYALIRGHYRQPLNFTWDILDEATKAVANLDDLARRLRLARGGTGAAADPRDGTELLAELRGRFEAGMNDDLNVPAALAALFELRGAVLEQRLGREVAGEALAFVEQADTVLGVIRTEEESLDERVTALIEARNDARARKDWAAADRVRQELLADGILLEDTAEGTIWRRR